MRADTPPREEGNTDPLHFRPIYLQLPLRPLARLEPAGRRASVAHSKPGIRGGSQV